jgi:hypothetical protein
MKKVKFLWDFEFNKEEKQLTVNLNDGCNCIIDLTYDTAFEHIANKLAEILKHEHYMGTKTEIFHLEQAYKAMHFIKEYDAEMTEKEIFGGLQ